MGTNGGPRLLAGLVWNLYAAHRGKFKIDFLDRGNIKNISKRHRTTIKVVVAHYGDKTAQYLSELTHHERPWKDAREGLSPTERGNSVISLESMAEYYGGL